MLLPNTPNMAKTMINKKAPNPPRKIIQNIRTLFFVVGANFFFGFAICLAIVVELGSLNEFRSKSSKAKK
jgi:uncharacterized BrkB/YihY/UPF0761 family membrane protein